MCASCGQCARFAVCGSKEPMKSHPLPDNPWQVVSQDLCYFEGSDYMVTVDHYSDFIEVDELEDTLSSTVAKKSKAQFARHGIPEVLLSDNGPQFIGTDYKSFCNLYGITHVTSSPYWPKGNGKAESAVKIVKSLMKKSSDWQLAILHYRNTPQQGHTLAPAQRSMSRRLRSTLPVAKKLLVPSAATPDLVKAQIEHKRLRAKMNYDKSVSAHEPPSVEVGDYVYAKPPPQKRGGPWTYGRVIDAPRPRSYVIESKTGTLRRNRSHINPAPLSVQTQKKSVVDLSPQIVEGGPQGGTNTLGVPAVRPPVHTSDSNMCTPKDSAQLISAKSVSPEMPYCTRSGREVKPPKTYDPSDNM